jgi:exodeoxyribonuclease V alpha subunit
MKETTRREASTIAMLLVRVEKRDEQLTDEPLVIIDESSMVDLPSLYRLLRAMPPGARLLLVGDPGQLPPVGFGLTFHLLAVDAAVPRAVLTQPLRQTDASGIPRVCSAIREGRLPDLLAWNPDLRDGVAFIDATPCMIKETVLDVVAELGPTPAHRSLAR